MDFEIIDRDDPDQQFAQIETISEAAWIESVEQDAEGYDLIAKREKGTGEKETIASAFAGRKSK